MNKRYLTICKECYYMHIYIPEINDIKALFAREYIMYFEDVKKGIYKKA